MTVARTKAQSKFGSVTQLPSGRWRARYRTPGATRGAPFVNAPHTFDTAKDANTWLALERAKIVQGTWRPRDADMPFQDYAESWLIARPRKQKTLDHYRYLLDRFILPTFGHLPLSSIQPKLVRSWYSTTCVDTPTQRAHAYTLLKGIFKAAVDDDLIVANPCRISGASTARRVSRTVPATPDELATIVESVPSRYRLMILLAAWCALRFGELIELRVNDFDFRRNVIKIRRAVTWVKDAAVIEGPREADELDARVTVSLVGTPKTDAGVRDVAIPPHLIPAIKDHIESFCDAKDDLLFPAARDPRAHLRPATLYKVFYRARERAGRPDLRFHDLRHTGAVMYAHAGATVADLMHRLGHSTSAAAMRYQHAAQGRDSMLANELSRMAAQQAEPDAVDDASLGEARAQ